MSIGHQRITDNVAKNPYLLGLFPQLQEKKAKDFLMLACTLIAIVIFSLFAISPTISTIVQLQKQIKDNEFVIQELNTKIAHVSALQVQYAAIQDDLPIIFSAIPKTPQIPLFLGKIQQLAQESKVSLDRIQTYSVEVIATNNISDYTSFAFSVDAQGENTNITQFLTSLVHFDRIIHIDNISLTQSGQTGNTVQLSLKGKAYFKKI